MRLSALQELNCRALLLHMMTLPVVDENSLLYDLLEANPATV